jgi:hypothetical protein
MSSGSVVVFDDASWRTIGPVVRRFARRRTVLYEIASDVDDFVAVQIP